MEISSRCSTNYYNNLLANNSNGYYRHVAYDRTESCRFAPVELERRHRSFLGR